MDKIILVLLPLILAQTTASFFGEVSYSLGSWQSSVGNLFSSAASDLKDTYDCTVFAMKQVYYSYETIPDYYKKCIDEQDNNTSTIPPSTISQMTNVTIETQNDKMEKEIQIVEKDLLNETRLLTEMNLKLQQEFEDLSKQVNEDFEKLQNEQKKQSIEKVMEQIDKVHDQEAIHVNNTDREVHAAFDKVLNKLDQQKNIDRAELKQEIKAVLEEMESNKSKSGVELELLNWKQEELAELKEVKQLLKRKRNLGNAPKPTRKMNSSTTKSTTPVTSTAVSSTTPVITTQTVSSTVATTTTIKSTTLPVSTTMNPSQTTTTIPTTPYASLQNGENFIQSALSLFSKSREAASIMAKVMEKSQNAPSVFSKPNV